MLAGELIEMILQNLYGILHSRSLLAKPDLKHKTFAKVSRSHACRLELLNDLEHLQYFFFGSLDIRPERKIIHDAVYASAKITVIIKAADKERSHGILMFSKIPISELFLKTLGEALLHRKRIVLRTFILRIIIRPEAIARYRVILLIF